MALVIEELLLIKSRHTRTRRLRLVSGHSCAICESEVELISVAAGARLVSVDSRELCDRLGRLTESADGLFRPETLVCLNCLSKCRVPRSGTGL